MTALTPRAPLGDAPSTFTAFVRMTKRGITLGALGALGLVAACAKGDDANDRDTTAASTPAGGSAAGATATDAASGEWMSDADIRTLASYRLSNRNLDELERAVKNVTELNRSDPAVMRRLDMEDDARGNVVFSIKDVVSRAESEPKLRRAVESASMSVRDFVVASFALSAAHNMATQDTQSMPDTNAMPAETRAAMRELHRMAERMRRAVPDENVAFVRANQARVQRIIASMEEMSSDDAQQDSDTTGR